MGSQRGRLEGQSWAGHLPSVLLPAHVEGQGRQGFFFFFMAPASLCQGQPGWVGKMLAWSCLDPRWPGTKQALGQYLPVCIPGCELLQNRQLPVPQLLTGVTSGFYLDRAWVVRDTGAKGTKSLF